MGTKNNPGKYDCYANAEPDEPMFVLLGRDEHAPATVRMWAQSKLGEYHRQAAEARSVVPPERIAKIEEALDCAEAMEAWRAANRA